MKDCNQTKVKLLHELTKISWYLETYAGVNAESAEHPACNNLYNEMQADLEKHIGKLKDAVGGLANEGKF